MSKKKKDIIADVNRYRENAYYYYEIQAIMAMFDYKNIPFRKEFLEVQLLKHGWAAIAKDEKGDIYAGYCATYDIDEYGLPTGQCNFFTRHGYNFPAVIGETCIIGYNNDIRLPEFLLEQSAKFFSETDISMMSCLVKSRVNPVPVASDSKVKKAIDDILSDVEAGDTKTIAYEGAIDDILEGKDPVTVLNLTDPKQTDKLQYLSKFFDDNLRRIATFYGHSLSSGSKMAQVTSAELEGYTTFSRIYPNVLLESRKAFLDEVNAAFGTDYSVEFGEAWEHLNNPIVLDQEEGGAEDDSEESAPQPSAE